MSSFSPPSSSKTLQGLSQRLTDLLQPQDLCPSFGYQSQPTKAATRPSTKEDSPHQRPQQAASRCVLTHGTAACPAPPSSPHPGAPSLTSAAVAPTAAVPSTGRSLHLTLVRPRGSQRQRYGRQRQAACVCFSVYLHTCYHLGGFFRW